MSKQLEVLLGEFLYLMLVLGGLYIYIPVAPSHCSCYGGFNASFGNASWSMMCVRLNLINHLVGFIPCQIYLYFSI